MKKLIYKLIGSSVCLGIIASVIPFSGHIKASKATTQQELQKKINNIHRVTKSFKLIQFYAGAISAGGATLAALTEVALYIGLLALIPPALLISSDPYRPKRHGFIKINPKFNIESNPIFQLTVLLASGFVSLPFIYRLFGLVTPENISHAFYDAREFSKNMNPLNPKQQQIVQKFQRKLKGPLLLGIVKGVRLKNSLDNHTKQIVHNNAGTFQSISNKQAISTTKTYLKNRLAQRNLFEVHKKIKSDIAAKRADRNKHSKWAPAYHIKNINLITLEKGLKYKKVKTNLSKTNRNIISFHTAHPGSQTQLKEAVQHYISDIDQILKESK